MMDTYEFHIGDRVVCLNPVSGNGDVVGLSGTVVCNEYRKLGVKFDSKIRNGHNCQGACEYGFGWFVAPSDIEILLDQTPKITISYEELMN